MALELGALCSNPTVGPRRYCPNYFQRSGSTSPSSYETQHDPVGERKCAKMPWSWYQMSPKETPGTSSVMVDKSPNPSEPECPTCKRADEHCSPYLPELLWRSDKLINTHSLWTLPRQSCLYKSIQEWESGDPTHPLKDHARSYC